MYTKPVQTAFATNLQPGEFVVQLDTGQLVAVCATNTVEPNTGNPVVRATARVVAADGTSLLDASGASLDSAFTHTSNQAEVNALGGMPQLQLRVLRAVLGEDTTPLWTDPIHASVRDHANIRLNIASAAYAGTADNLAGLL